MGKIEYYIIEEDNICDLSVRVEKYLSNGYTLQGGVSAYSRRITGTTYYMQAVIKESK